MKIRNFGTIYTKKIGKTKEFSLMKNVQISEEILKKNWK